MVQLFVSHVFEVRRSDSSMVSCHVQISRYVETKHLMCCNVRDDESADLEIITAMIT